jgi:hypothetical protein
MNYECALLSLRFGNCKYDHHNVHDDFLMYYVNVQAGAVRAFWQTRPVWKGPPTNSNMSIFNSHPTRDNSSNSSMRVKVCCFFMESAKFIQTNGTRASSIGKKKHNVGAWLTIGMLLLTSRMVIICCGETALAGTVSWKSQGFEHAKSIMDTMVAMMIADDCWVFHQLVPFLCILQSKCWDKMEIRTNYYLIYVATIL